MTVTHVKWFAIIACSLLLACSGEFDGKNGIKTIKFPDVDKVCQLIEYKDGMKNGTLKEFYRNGNLKVIQHFKDDKNVDSTIFYHPNGQLAVIQIHKEGRREGCWKKFNEAGKVYSEINFRDDLLDGPSKTYSYKSLRLIESYNFKNGLRDGKWETFYNSGKPKSVAYYYNDQPGLGAEEYLENGEKINDDFAMKVTESNKVNLENRLYFYVSLTDPRPDDEVWRVVEKDTGRVLTRYQRLEKKDNVFVLEFGVYEGGFIMEKVKIAAYRKTASGNTMIKTTTFNASANHY